LGFPTGRSSTRHHGQKLRASHIGSSTYGKQVQIYQTHWPHTSSVGELPPPQLPEIRQTSPCQMGAHLPIHVSLKHHQLFQIRLSALFKAPNISTHQPCRSPMKHRHKITALIKHHYFSMVLIVGKIYPEVPHGAFSGAAVRRDACNRDGSFFCRSPEPNLICYPTSYS
jgi:hypothetical protein